ncbi:MAG: hypothetical protein RR810_06675, partial [Clostridia bacterium]
IVGYSDNRGLVDANGNPSTTFNRLNGRVEVVFLGANNFKYFNGTEFVGDVRKTGGTDNPKNYVVHPAFSAVRRTGYTKKTDGNFGWNSEIPGFWVAKFEMASGCTSKSNMPSERNMTISNMFTEGEKIATTRQITGADSMLITNTQWGAVAYLTKAMGKEPDINTSYTTASGNYIAYANQSTTGNATGVYDMSGCGWDSVSTYVNYGTLNVAYGKKLLDNKDSKYVDVYADGGGGATQSPNYEANADKYGDAQYEVSISGAGSDAWSGGNSFFPIPSYTTLVRGGRYSTGTAAGVFAFCDAINGQSTDTNGWRRSFHFLTSIQFTLYIHNYYYFTLTYTSKKA